MLPVISGLSKSLDASDASNDKELASIYCKISTHYKIFSAPVAPLPGINEDASAMDDFQVDGKKRRRQSSDLSASGRDTLSSKSKRNSARFCKLSRVGVGRILGRLSNPTQRNLDGFVPTKFGRTRLDDRNPACEFPFARADGDTR